MAKIYLQLSGAESYASRTTGLLKRGQSIELQDAELAKKLLQKGGHHDDGSHRPLFRQVSKAQAERPVDPDNLNAGDLSAKDLNPDLIHNDPAQPSPPDKVSPEVRSGLVDPAAEETGDTTTGGLDDDGKDTADVREPKTEVDEPAAPAGPKVTRGQRAK